MSHIPIDYQLTRDGAPLRILPVGNSAGEWVVICKCCNKEWVEPDVYQAFLMAHAHTFIAEATGSCPSGRAAQHRHEHMARFGFYHEPSDNWRNHMYETRKATES